MDTIISMVSDMIILIFNLSMYVGLTPLKKDDRKHRGILVGCLAITTALYMVAAYVCSVPYAAASFMCMTVPSFILCFSLSKYKNTRFLVTFCFVDTVTFIIAAIAKLILIVGGILGGLLSTGVMLLLCLCTYFGLRPYFKGYRDLMEQVTKGWGPMAVSTLLIYLLLVFFPAYPQPLITRMEYVPLFFLLCITVLSFYGVFIILIIQKAKLSKANELLKQQQHWHDMAFLDELTQLANPAAYAARTKELEQAEEKEQCHLIIFDIDDFKHVNDTYGHQVGNEVLQKTADFFRRSFSKNHYEFFRIGGDEFAAITRGLSTEEVQNRVDEINRMPLKKNLGCTYSCGFSPVNFSRENAFQNAFITADQSMYNVKTEKKKK